MQITALPMLRQDKPPVTAEQNLLQDGSVKIKVRKKKVSVTVGKRGSPSSSEGPWNKTHTYITHTSSHWLAKILVLVRGAEEPAQPMAFTETLLPTMLHVYQQGSAWELLKQGFHGSYLLRALLIFCNPKVCSRLSIQTPANTTGTVIL